MEPTQYIGIDLHKKFFQGCGMNADGERCWEGRFPRSGEGMAAFLARCPAGAVVAVEASSPTWHFVDQIRPGVAQVHVVDPRKTRLKAGYAAKTDRLDARRLADALRRDSIVGIYYPPLAIRELRELCRHRHTLVRVRSSLVQRIRALLLRQGIGDSPMRRLASQRGLRWLAEIGLEGRAAATLDTLRTLVMAVNAELTPVETEVAQAAARDPIVAALETLPGVGPVLGLTIRAEIGGIERFPSGAHLASYAGLVPYVDQSAMRCRYGRITKAGSPWLRWALVEAAMHGLKRSDPVGRWARRLAMRKGVAIAHVAVARHLCAEIVERWRQMT